MLKKEVAQLRKDVEFLKSLATKNDTRLGIMLQIMRNAEDEQEPKYTAVRRQTDAEIAVNKVEAIR